MITSSWAARWSSSSSARARRESRARWATSSRAIGMVAILGARSARADLLFRPLAGGGVAGGALAGGGGAGRGRALVQQHAQPGLVQDRHPQAERLGVLGAGILARHHEAGLLRDRARRLAAQRRHRLG